MAEKKYIDVEAAIKLFNFAVLDCLGMEPTIRAGDIIKALESIPAADVVPVVRCKDCQYCHADRAGNIGCFHYSHYQTSWGGKIKPEDYCSLGRKREA